MNTSKMDYVKNFVKSTPMHIVTGAVVTGVKFISDKYPANKVAEYLTRSFTALPNYSVAGLSVSAFALGAVVSVASSCAIKKLSPYIYDLNIATKEVKGSHVITDTKKQVVGKLAGQFGVTLLTGVVATLAFTGLCTLVAGTVFGWSTAIGTGLTIGALVFTAKKITEFVTDKFAAIWNKNLNKFLSTDHNAVETNTIKINGKQIDPVTLLTYNQKANQFTAKIGGDDINLTDSDNNARLINNLAGNQTKVLEEMEAELKVLQGLKSKAASYIWWFSSKKNEINNKLPGNLDDRILLLNKAIEAWKLVKAV